MNLLWFIIFIVAIVLIFNHFNEKEDDRVLESSIPVSVPIADINNDEKEPIYDDITSSDSIGSDMESSNIEFEASLESDCDVIMKNINGEHASVWYERYVEVGCQL